MDKKDIKVTPNILKSKDKEQFNNHSDDIDKNVKYVTISKNYNDNDKKLEKKEE